VILNEDYWRNATLSFEGGLVAQAKMIGLGMKAIHAQQKAAPPIQPWLFVSRKPCRVSPHTKEAG